MITADHLHSIMRNPIALTELQHARLQIRVLTALLLGNICFQLIDPAIYILTVESSFYHRVALSLRYPLVLATCFFALAGTLVPHIVFQVLRPSWLDHRNTARVACFGLFGAGLLWVFLAWHTWGWDVQTISGVFIRIGVGCMGFSLAIAVSLNAELARRYLGQP
jgi:hypothetical protein